ncbi:MAG: SurA N-terminal domain-containing protein, partial [Armatimonadetes bacterium]|nr:SurA N-terminal domain-containing protein [Anaerolineae bacterium]
MAKKRQTTGLPKIPAAAVKAQGAPVKPGAPLKEYETVAQREAEVQRRILLATAIAGAVIVVLLAIAFVVEVLIRPNLPVANVNGETITVAQFQERLKIEHAVLDIQFSNALNQYAQLSGGDVNQAFQQLTQQEPYSTWSSELQFPDTLANRVLNDLIDDKLVEVEAAKLGITVGDAEADEQINNFIGYDPERVAAIGVEPTATPTATISPTPYVSPTPSQVPTATLAPTDTATVTPLPEGSATAALTVTAANTATATATLSATEVTENFNVRREDLYGRLGRVAGVGEDAVRRFFRAKALREAVGKTISTSVIDDKTLFVNARHILVATTEEAQSVLGALQAGESFADLARARSTDTGSGARGGELGWSATYGFVPEFAAAVTDAPIGELFG